MSTREEQRLRRSDLAQYLLDTVRKRAGVQQGKVVCTLFLKDIQVPEVCPDRGTPFQRGNYGQKTANSPTVVRLDPKLGFVPGNIEIISWAAAQQRQPRRPFLRRWQELQEQKQAEALALQRLQEKLELAREKKQLQQEESAFALMRQVRQELERPIYCTQVKEMPLGCRLRAAFQRLGIQVVADVMRYTLADFNKLPNFGRKSVVELSGFMQGLGILWPNLIAKQLLQPPMGTLQLISGGARL